MRARAHIEELRGGKNAIIVTELPYGVRKGGEGGVIEKIADLVKNKVLTEIPMSDDALADHSDKDGMRIYIELKREAIPQVALNKLFKHTPLQTTFGYNAVALVDGVPKTLSLLELIRHYLDYQREVVTRRSKYELRKAEERAHVLQRLPDRARQPRRGHQAHPRRRRHGRGARGQLMEQFDAVSEIQAQAILDLRLRASDRRSRARGSRTSTPTCRSGSPSCARISRRPCAHRRRDQGGAARAAGDLRAQRRAPDRDRRGRGRARARGSDRGGGHGDRDHALRLHQAPTGDDVSRAAPRRHRRDGDGAQGRRLHRAPVRRLDARLHPLLHERRQGLPPQGARAAARLAPVEGPRDRQPAAVPPGRAGARGHPDARLQGGRVPRLRDEERRREEDEARGVQHAI